MTAWLVIFGIGVGINASLAFIAVGLFVLLFWNALMTCEVRVGSEAISRRSWFAIANGLPATTFRPTPGRPITLMPDGLWLLDGVAFAPRVAWWEQRRLRRAIDEAGLVVDDEKGAWEQAHRLWSLARWGLFSRVRGRSAGQSSRQRSGLAGRALSATAVARCGQPLWRLARLPAANLRSAKALERLRQDRGDLRVGEHDRVRLHAAAARVGDDGRDVGRGYAVSG